MFSCAENEKNNLPTIKVDIQKKYPKGEFKDYFSSSILIPLETTNNSLFSNIDRISLTNDKIFILDKRLGSILIFDNKGTFLNKIQNIGNGPEEYTRLMDFTVNADNKELILLTNGPNKILKFNYKGQFINEIKANDYYTNIGYKNNKLLFVYKNKEKGKLFQEFDQKTKKKKNYIEMDDFDVFFWLLQSRYPYITSSKNTLITSLNSEIIYKYDNKGFHPEYKIDFGKNKVPDNIVNKFDSNYNGLSKYIIDNNYGFGISNFRENRNYITFNFWGNMIVIYSKKLNEAKAFSSFYNPNDQFYFSNYIGHDGDDNKIISKYSADSFKNQMKSFKEDVDKWKKIPDYIKNFDKKVKSTDNPLLIIYSFK